MLMECLSNFPESLRNFQFDLPVSALAVFVLSRAQVYETIWDRTNRICDRYFPAAEQT